MQPRHLIPTFLISAVFFVAGYFVALESVDVRESDDSVGIRTAHVVIDYGNDTVKTFSDVPLNSEDVVVWDVLAALAENSEIAIDYEDYGAGMGYFLTGIDGTGTIDQDSTKWWHYWVNAEYALKGISEERVESGDTIFLKYTKARESL